MRRTTPRAGLVLFALALTLVFSVAGAAAASARAWLGVITQEISGDLRDGLGLDAGAGVIVNRVLDGSPADQAGLRKGDVITRFNSRAVESPSTLQELVAGARSGQDVALDIVRRGDRRTLTVTLGTWPNDTEMLAPEAPEPPDAPEPPAAPAPSAPGEHGRKNIHIRIQNNGGPAKEYNLDDGDLDQLPPDARVMVKRLRNGGDLKELGKLGDMGSMHPMMMAMGRGRLGVRVQSLDEDLASALGVSGKDGVLVLGVEDDTPAQKAGLRAGDVILGVNGDDVKDADALVQALRDVDGKASLSVSRKGERRTVEADLGPAPRKLRDDGMMMRHQGRMGGSEDSSPRARVDSGADDLRQQIDDLRQQLRELRKQLEEQHHE